MAKALNLLYIILLIIIINFSHATVTVCKYQQDKDDTKGADANNTYLTTNTEDKSETAVCHSLSHTPVNTGICCYDTTDKKCVQSNGEASDLNAERYKCPEITKVHNSCGMAGIYQPIEESVCTEISLVGGYCCFVTSKYENKNTTSCLRNQKLSKNVNDITDQIKEVLADFSAEFVSMKCQGSYMKNIWVIAALVTLFLF